MSAFFMPKKIKTKPVKKEPKKISLSLVCGDKTYTADTDTIAEALDIIYKESFGKLKTWGVFTLKTENKKTEIRLRPIQIKRIFIMKFAKELFEKRAMMNLK
jgi:hypothetical protein